MLVRPKAFLGEVLETVARHFEHGSHSVLLRVLYQSVKSLEITRVDAGALEIAQLTWLEPRYS